MAFLCLLACATQEEIAEAVGVTQQSADNWTDDFCKTCQEQELQFPPGFEPPIYNVWKQQTKTNAFPNRPASRFLS